MKHPSEKYCYECAALLPRSATVCGTCLAAQPALPHARLPETTVVRPARSWDASHALLAVGAALLVAMGLHALRTPPPATSASAPAADASPAATESLEAWAEARRLVAKHLRAPPNAAFASEHDTTRLAPGTYEISSYLEANNTHGQLVRTTWTAVVARQPDGWRLESLNARN